MLRNRVVTRICRDGLLLAVLCVLGMFSIPLGENVKVSLQLLVVFLIALLSEGAVDTILITGSYALLGLFLPIYAGFNAGITPTFGFVLGFVLAAPGIYFFNQIKAIPSWPRMILACLLGLLPVYACGVAWMMVYLGWDFPKTALVAIVPYLPFDAVKIVLAVLLAKGMPALVLPRKKASPKSEGEKEADEGKNEGSDQR